MRNVIQLLFHNREFHAVANMIRICYIVLNVLLVCSVNCSGNSENKICDSSYVKKGKGEYIDSDNSSDYEHTFEEVIRSLPGQKTFLFTSGDVQQICEPFLEEDVKEARLVNLGIEYIKPGSFNKPQLPFILLLAKNKLQHIPDGAFSNTSIALLDLSDNWIQTIDEHAFDNMPYLEVLILDNNKIESWNSEWFLNTPSIHSISIQHNLLSSIPKHALKNVQGSLEIQNVPVFSSINFESNRIAAIHPEAFVDQKEFGKIDLRSNSLTSINPQIFQHFEIVHEVVLSENPIICFTRKALDSMKNIVFVQTHGIDLKEEC